MLRTVLRESELRTPALRHIAQRAQTFCASRRMVWLLFALGIMRNVGLLLAYPPARGADATLYFLSAEQLGGALKVPLASEFAYPLYPLLILICYRWLGSMYWLIALQFVMSAMIAPLYYAALKRYSPLLAVLVGLIILGDMQLALTFNLVMTEPLYIFLMAVYFYVFLYRVDVVAPDGWRWGDLWCGLLLSLLLLTRSVARFLIVPFALLFWLKTRQWRRALVVLSGFAAGLLVYTLLSSASVGTAQGLNTGDYMIGSLMVNHPDWVSPENGPNSQQWIALLSECPNRYSFLSCVQNTLGGWDETMRLFSGAARETILSDLPRYSRDVWAKMMDFLSLPAIILGIDPVVPSEAQCQGLDRIDSLSDEDFARQTRVSLLGLRSAEAITAYRPQLEAFLKAMCPPLPHVPALRSVVDALSWRYRSLGRPQPYLWYGAVFLLVLLVPRARRYLMVVLAAGALLFNHAAISALISNAQPRYVLAVNPMRAILLCILVYVVMTLGVYCLDWLLSRRLQASSANV